MKMSLQNTQIHKSIKRAFPQTNWPELALAELERFKEGEVINGASLTDGQKNIFTDLATAGLIESIRYPKYVCGQFAGFEHEYVYRANLDYSRVQFVDKKKKSLLIGIYAALLLLGWALVLCYYILNNL